jgi:ABC-type glycerol-3-phosphate transport system substrate-binding protein
MPSPSEEEALAQQGGWGSSAIKFMGAGRLATAIGGRWWLCTLRQYQGLRLGAVQSPHGPYRRYIGYGRSTVINSNSPHRREALKFLLYMSGPEYNRLINQQADALGPSKRYCTDENLFNPAFPEEDFHRACRDVMEFGVPEESSPFVNAAVVDRIMTKQMDLIKRDAKSPAEGMTTAAKQINEQIEKTLARAPALRQRYEELTRSKAAEGGRP